MTGYATIYEKTATGYSAYCPDLPGLGVAGRSLEETKRLIQEGIEIYADELRARGEAVPEPTTQVEYVALTE